MKFSIVVILISLTLGFSLESGVCKAGFDHLEADARTVPWDAVTRLALEGGAFPPAYRPVTEKELADLLAASRDRVGEQDSARLLWLLDRYQTNNNKNWRFSGRMIGGYSELGNPLPMEGGLSFAAGHNIYFEPCIEFATGNFWSAVNFRFGGRWAPGGVAFDDANGSTEPLTWPGWSLPTGRATVRDARLKSGAWTGQLTRALVGMQLGNWALSAGLDHRRTGPGLTGSLNLDYEGRPFPAVTARRTDSFHWGGILTHLAPDQLLLRTGILSEQTIAFRTGEERILKDSNPWFFQWLVGWDITSWFRTNFTHTVMATAREGTLWPYLGQINFPLLRTTWDEMVSGPVTDRLFAAHLEARWCDAPWPLLPAAAGRVFWDYGGTDFIPWGYWEAIPEISVPASILGFELFSPGWDLGFEYAELQHTHVLWYSNNGFADGYTHEQWLMGHPLGGSGESFTGLVRVRPQRWDYQIGLQGKAASWGMKGKTPGTGERHSIALTLSRTPRGEESSPLLWEVTAEWNREKAGPDAFLNSAVSGSEVSRDWWRVVFKLGI